jgi:hypothetical protein
LFTERLLETGAIASGTVSARSAEYGLPGSHATGRVARNHWFSTDLFFKSCLK